MIQIRAGTAGFHFLSPLGALMAPDVFLNTALYPKGDIALTTAGSVWQSEDSIAWAGTQVLLDGGTRFNPEDDAAPAVGSVSISTIRFARAGDGSMVEIGRIDLPTPLEIPVYRDPGGDDGNPSWHGEVAAAFAALIRAEGYRFLGGPGDDVFAPHAEILPIYGPVVILGRGGDDFLRGGRNDETIRGGAGDDTVLSGGGTDDIFGGRGADDIALDVWSAASRARGGPGNDRLTSSNGDDILVGNAGDDVLIGGRGDDRLMGNLGDDTLDGGEGRDRIVGGPGSDLLTGGDGADIFVFRANQPGHDTITDYDPIEDRLRIRPLGDPVVLAIAQDGVDTLITWNDGASSIRIEGVDIADLGADLGADPGDVDAFLF